MIIIKMKEKDEEESVGKSRMKWEGKRVGEMM